MPSSSSSSSSKPRPKPKSPPLQPPPPPPSPAAPQSSLSLQKSSSFGRNKYLVSSHSVRITKFGYAIDPIELRYAEITSKLTPSQRRQSDAALDSGHLGHKMLTLIRGYWSQPAWPRGRQMTPKQQQQQEKQVSQLFRVSSTENPIDALITYFRSNSFYPHRRTLGQMSMAPVSPPPPPPSAFTPRFSKKKAKEPAKVARQKSPDTSLYYMSWIPRNKEVAAEMVSDLCRRMEEIFANEPRILNIASPCTVLGDIHGNLLDLRTYERSLWPKAPTCLTSNFLFLGDYVDRGDYSVECVLYLFAMKLIAPSKFFLLRGNHEIATIQRQYTFGSECETKFGHAGRQLWRQFNKVFNVMPIAAIIDEQIFCAHGGIPRTMTDISQLAREIPTPLENPEIQSPAAWEILWNDPITDSELVAMLEMDGASLFSMANQGANGTAVSQPLPAPASATAPMPAPVQQTPVENLAPPAVKSATLAKSVDQGPFESALSFYVRPPDQPALPNQPTQTTQPSQPTQTPQSSAQPTKEQAQKEQSRGKGGQTRSKRTDRPEQPVLTEEQQQAAINDTLRTFPSDTSSIASTTPAQLLNDGFVANIKRGTAFLFSDRAIETFLEANKFSHVIRAHEVIPTGFAFHGDGRVITIFSSSQYCGLNNQAACCLVDNSRIRILRLDTGEAGE